MVFCLQDFGAGGLRLGCLISQNREFTDAARAICRFASPSQYSMYIASRLLEDQDYVNALLDKSNVLLAKNRLLAESLLSQAGITYHDKGYVYHM